MPTSQFIAAKISQMRTLSETSVAEEKMEGGVSLVLSDESSTEVRWEVSDDREVLSIVPELKVTFKDADSNAERISYKSRHEIRFVVLGYTGFNPQDDLPDDAIAPYIAMALWIVRGRATQSIRGLGIPSFTWPNPAAVEVEAQPVPKAKNRGKVAKAPARKVAKSRTSE